MNNELPTSIRSLVADEGVKELQLWFTDILGELEKVTLTGGQLDVLLECGVMASDSSTSGFGQSAGSDIVAVPDWTTFTMLPASPSGQAAAAVFCCLESMGLLAVDQRVLA